MDAAALGRLSTQVGKLLRYGVALSALLLAVGVLLAAVGDPSADPLAPLDGPNPSTWGPGLPGLVVIVAGLVALVATPIVRVLASLRTFWASRERDYAMLVAMVLVVMSLSVVAGLLL